MVCSFCSPVIHPSRGRNTSKRRRCAVLPSPRNGSSAAASTASSVAECCERGSNQTISLVMYAPRMHAPKKVGFETCTGPAGAACSR